MKKNSRFIVLLFLVIVVIPVAACKKMKTPAAPSVDTPVPADTASMTPTATYTSYNTFTCTATVTETDTAMDTSTVTATITETNTPPATLTVTSTCTDTSSQTVTATMTETVTETLTVTDTASITQTATQTNTPTVTQTITATFTCTETKTITQTVTDTVTGTVTPTTTITPTATVTLTSTNTPNETATMTVLLQGTFNATGNAAGQWSRPWGICADDFGAIWVAGINSRYSKLTGTTGAYIEQFGTYGAPSEEGKITDALDIGVDGFNNKFTADAQSYKVSLWNSANIYQTRWNVDISTIQTAGGLAVDQNGNFYTTAGCGIAKYSSSGSLIKYTDVYSGGGSCMMLQEVAVKRDGSVAYAIAVGDNFIRKFNANLDFVGTIGSMGTNPGQFMNPIGMDVDKNGNLFVVDSVTYRVSMFNSSGQFVKWWGSYGTGTGQFVAPKAVACDPYGNVFVTDSSNSRILKFKP